MNFCLRTCHALIRAVNYYPSQWQLLKAKFWDIADYAQDHFFQKTAIILQCITKSHPHLSEFFTASLVREVPLQCTNTNRLP